MCVSPFLSIASAAKKYKTGCKKNGSISLPISLAPDGTEDNEIHCFKPEGQWPKVKPLLHSTMADQNIETLQQEYTVLSLMKNKIVV